MSKRLTEQRLLNMALFYLSQYESSDVKLRTVLKRRLQRLRLRGEEVPPEADSWIESVIAKVQKNAYLDNTRYAENQVRVMVTQGKSEKFMTLKLQEAGIDAATVHALIEQSGTSEIDRACRYAYKKRIGMFRPPAERVAHRQKDMAALARAGFSYDVTVTVLDGRPGWKKPDSWL